MHNRKLKIKRLDLISRIEANKLEHVKEYEEVVIAYKVEALRQLSEASKAVDGGALTVKIQLLTPVNLSSKYDKIKEMFTWEQDETIELTEGEFNEYVHDDTPEARSAKGLNTLYSNKF